VVNQRKGEGHLDRPSSGMEISRLAKNASGEKLMDSKSLAKTEASQKLQEISDMIYLAKLTFCGKISAILLGPMRPGLDEEDAWSHLDHYLLIFFP
jgi:hypothetical protein